MKQLYNNATGLGGKGSWCFLSRRWAGIVGSQVAVKQYSKAHPLVQAGRVSTLGQPMGFKEP